MRLRQILAVFLALVTLLSAVPVTNAEVLVQSEPCPTIASNPVVLIRLSDDDDIRLSQIWDIEYKADVPFSVSIKLSPTSNQREVYHDGANNYKPAAGFCTLLNAFPAEASKLKKWPLRDIPSKPSNFSFKLTSGEVVTYSVLYVERNALLTPRIEKVTASAVTVKWDYDRKLGLLPAADGVYPAGNIGWRGDRARNVYRRTFPYSQVCSKPFPQNMYAEHRSSSWMVDLVLDDKNFDQKLTGLGSLGFMILVDVNHDEMVTFLTIDGGLTWQKWTELFILNGQGWGLMIRSE